MLKTDTKESKNVPSKEEETVPRCTYPLIYFIQHKSVGMLESRKKIKNITVIRLMEWMSLLNK